jgi:hypothetical protein
MSMREGLTLLPWLVGAAASLALSAFWMLGAQDGMVSAYALIPLMWSVALGAGFVHHLRESGVLQRYLLAMRPVSGQPSGA